MDGSDEFDRRDNAPLPPHERDWRHPAEVSDENRRRHLVESAPPPVGRRVKALVGFVSLFSSAVILAVTLPRGLDDRPATEPRPDQTTSTVLVKGGTDTSAVAVMPHVVAATGPEVTAAQLPDGRMVDTTLLQTTPGHRLNLLSTDALLPAIPSNDLTDDEFRYLAAEGRLALEVAGGKTTPVSLGIRTVGTDKWWPFEADSEFGSVARILDSEGNLVGVAVRDRNSTWAMKLGDLVALISGATDDAAGG